MKISTAGEVIVFTGKDAGAPRKTKYKRAGEPPALR